MIVNVAGKADADPSVAVESEAVVAAVATMSCDSAAPVYPKIRPAVVSVTLSISTFAVAVPNAVIVVDV